jgi:hypothetical protein
VVRTHEGGAITDCACSDPLIARVRLDLVGAAGAVVGTTPCQGQAECRFSCQRHTGTTPFNIPPGSYLMKLVPLDALGQDLVTGSPDDMVQAPAPVRRDVSQGQPTQLDAFALVSGCASSCSANANRVCSK